MTRITGTLRAEAGTGAVRVQDRFDADATELWSALTEPDRLARWIAEVEGDLRPGGEFSARFTSGWAGTGRVQTCEPPRHLVVVTSDDDGETVIEATLTPDGEQTVLAIEERGLPLEVLPNHGAGWQTHVEDLGAHLAGRRRSDFAARLRELLPAYREPAQREPT